MKILKVTTFYSGYLSQFYSTNRGLSERDFSEQKAALDIDAFGWSDFWSQALLSFGYEAFEVTMNAESLQRAWAKEKGLSDHGSMSLEQIVIAQAKHFQPDILWFDDLDEGLLKSLRAEVGSIRLVLGWVGSAIPQSGIWRQFDLVFSCAQEAVDYLRQGGAQAEQLHHGFDPRVNERLEKGPKQYGVTFIGQLSRASQFHLEREKLLLEIFDQVGLNIFSPSACYGWRDDVKTLLKGLAYGGLKFLRGLGVPEDGVRRMPVFQGVANWEGPPVRPVSPQLKRHIHWPVYGLNMFQVVKDSMATLNIHADSSPLFASNMRLFEITGVGTCMVTDWKPNLSGLFNLEEEVVTYRSAEECVEKVTWLRDHPRECDAIARAGQARTLKEHSFEKRAERLDMIVKRELGGA